jgi:hypothetical protein
MSKALYNVQGGNYNKAKVNAQTMQASKKSPQSHKWNDTITNQVLLKE